MGFNPTSGYGALLADEMGMGKTLMSIALIWTLLKQTPLKGEPPLAKRVLIVCPVTLVNNWKTEIKKWLGPSRLGVMAITDSMSIDLGTVIRDFTYGRVNQVMIIGYERLLRISDQLQSANFDLVICDEGHRMKTAGNKAANAIQSLGSPERSFSVVLRSRTISRSSLSWLISSIPVYWALSSSSTKTT